MVLFQSTISVVASVYTIAVNKSYESKLSPTRREGTYVCIGNFFITLYVMFVLSFKKENVLIMLCNFFAFVTFF